jgi:hypothetical protein
MHLPTHIWPSINTEPDGEPDGGGAPAEPQADASTDTTDELTKLRKALEAQREEARRYRSKAQAAEAQLREVGDANPKILEEAQRKAEAAEQARMLAEEKANLKIQQMQRQLEEKTAKVLGEAQQRQAAAEREALRVKAERDFLAAEGLVEASSVDGRTPFDYVWLLHGDRIAEDASGRYIKDENGLPLLDPETNKRVTVKDFFSKLRDDPVHGIHFKPRYGSGGGARGGFDGRVSSGQDLSRLSTAEKFQVAFGRKS